MCTRKRGDRQCGNKATDRSWSGPEIAIPDWQAVKPTKIRLPDCCHWRARTLCPLRSMANSFNSLNCRRSERNAVGQTGQGAGHEGEGRVCPGTVDAAPANDKSADHSLLKSITVDDQGSRKFNFSLLEPLRRNRYRDSCQFARWAANRH